MQTGANMAFSSGSQMPGFCQAVVRGSSGVLLSGYCQTGIQRGISRFGTGLVGSTRLY